MVAALNVASKSKGGNPTFHALVGAFILNSLGQRSLHCMGHSDARGRLGPLLQRLDGIRRAVVRNCPYSGRIVSPGHLDCIWPCASESLKGTAPGIGCRGGCLNRPRLAHEASGLRREAGSASPTRHRVPYPSAASPAVPLVPPLPVDCFPRAQTRGVPVLRRIIPFCARFPSPVKASGVFALRVLIGINRY